MTEERFVQLSSGPFRALDWGAGAPTVLFLHGLSGVAEVWGPTVSHLMAGRRYLALDQRGHGHSPTGADLDYSARAFEEDAAEFIESLGTPVHLVGHSMGARIALLLAAHHPALLGSATIIDIGPDASRKNITDTLAALERRQERFESRDEAIAAVFRSRKPALSDEEILLARLMRGADGSYAWRSSREVLGECVTRQRSRSYWSEWRAISVPAMFVHGGASTEVSTVIAERMRAANPRVRFERLEGVGHNIPLIAPDALSALLEDFWRSAGES